MEGVYGSGVDVDLIVLVEEAGWRGNNCVLVSAFGAWVNDGLGWLRFTGGCRSAVSWLAFPAEVAVVDGGRFL